MAKQNYNISNAQAHKNELDLRVVMDENRRLREMITQSNFTNFFKRLDFLFRVVEYGNAFPNEFVAACTTEIVDTLTLVKPSGNEKEDKNDAAPNTDDAADDNACDAEAR